MPADARRMRARRLVGVASYWVMLGYALWLAATVPFSAPADVLTGIAIVFVTVMAIVRWPLHPDGGGLIPDEGAPRHPYLAWAVLFGVIVAWELVMYVVRGSRSAHPTLSSMADAFDRSNYVLKAIACFAWLWLGAAIVRAGSRASSRGASRGTPPA